MFKNIPSALIVFLLCFMCNGQSEKPTSHKVNNSPKLVVGIVVDQMRYDYLTRFYNKFGKEGFKRLIDEGFNCKNNHFNYIPTYTAPGHASIFTGTIPKYHGIIANDWYDKEKNNMVYCVTDDTVLELGGNAKAGRMSPRKMKTSTFADENRLFTQMRGKSIGISLKDRGAILPAGHTANAAYWFIGKEFGHFISSNYYMKSLPNWVNEFNASNTVKSYLKEWNTLYDISTYQESGSDLNDFETGFKGKETATFPYDLKTLSKTNEGFDILKTSPYGNSIVTDFSIEAIKAEQLGKDEHTDVLTISFSSTDYIGHNFGVNSKEIEDTYLRLDKDLERLLKVLDQEIGQDNYTLFLTSDHGAIDVPSYLKTLNIPAGYVDKNTFKTTLNAFVEKTFKTNDLITNISNNQIFLNTEKIKTLGLNINDVQEVIVNEIITYKHIDKAYTGKTMESNNFTHGIEYLLQNGYNQKQSGDVLFIADPAYISYEKTGSTHGSGLNYDTHVPLLFFGKGIKEGETLQKTEITDIAPTISALLGISYPNAAIGKPLEFILKDE